MQKFHLSKALLKMAGGGGFIPISPLPGSAPGTIEYKKAVFRA